ncbi:MAG TPA: hypothetical protein VGG33_21745 [Polyangia bacterium]
MSKAIRSHHFARFRATVLGLALGLGTLGLGAGQAHAQAPAPTAAAPAAAGPAKPGWVVACEADMQKHCATEVKANADVRPCLAKNEATLSDSCKDVFLRKYKILELCKGDFEKLCPGISDGRALTQCLNEKAAQVSDKCKSAMTRGTKQFKKEEAAAEKAAATDAAKAEKASKSAEEAAEKTASKAAKKNAKKAETTATP